MTSAATAYGIQLVGALSTDVFDLALVQGYLAKGADVTVLDSKNMSALAW